MGIHNGSSLSSTVPGMSDPSSSSEPTWKQLRLSLERPYKDDSGNKIPVLYDLAPDGTRIYEPYVSFGLCHGSSY